MTSRRILLLLLSLLAVSPAISQDPGPADPRVVKLIKEGSDLLAAQRHRQALEAFQAAVTLDPKAAGAWEGLGLGRFAMRDLEGSLEALERAVELEPDACRPRTALAQTLEALGRVERAIVTLEEAIRRDEECLPPRTYVASLLVGQGEFARAVRPLEEWIERAPRKAPVGLQLGAVVQLAESLSRTGRTDETIETLEKLGEPERNVAPFRLRRAEYYAQMRLLSHAEAELRAVLDQEPSGATLATTQEGLALILWQTDRYAEAVAAAKAALAVEPTRLQAVYTLGRALYFTGDGDGALAVINRARGEGAVPLAGLPDLAAVYRPSAAAPPGARLIEQGAALGIADRGRGRGSTWADLDRDGSLDLIASALEQTSAVYLSGRRHGAAAYREAAQALGLGNYASAQTNLVGDLNADGFPDVYAIRSGRLPARPGTDHNVLRLGGPGGIPGSPGFRDAGMEAGVDDHGQGTCGALADLDADGDLDLYVVNGPGPNRLFLNQGDAVFREVAAVAHADDPGTGRGIAVGDIDNDGDQDLFVANQHGGGPGAGGGNLLYRNDGRGGDGIPRFSEIAKAAGVAGDGSAMAPLFADLDNDGDLDLVVAAFNSWDGARFFHGAGGAGSPHRLYRNDGVGSGGTVRFTDVSRDAGIDRIGGGQGIASGDLDHDGWIDLYVAMGGPEPGRAEPDLLFRNLGGLRFEEVGAAWGAASPGRSHGVTLVDEDGDGDLDIYVPSGGFHPGDGAPNLLYRNEAAQGHWLEVSLRGLAGNPTAVGARVVVRTASGTHLRELTAGSGTGSQEPPVLHFGLGQSKRFESIEVRWPGSGVTRLPAGPANQALVIAAPTGGAAAEAPPGSDG